MSEGAYIPILYIPLLIILMLAVKASLTACGGARAWSKGSGLGPDGVGLRGFKSHPPHF
jgi:hypothetical protein